jgi:arylsulfatase A-like enzyme
LGEIELHAARLKGDLDDCAPSLANPTLYAFLGCQMLFKHKEKPLLYQQWLQACMACVAFIDDQVGTVLDALEAGPHANNTIVILTSDHGFHVGDKEALYKQTLWNSGTRIPFIVAGLEGMPKGVVCRQPISLIDVYPTFVDLCGLPKDPNKERSGYPLEGHSIKPLLLNPGGGWTGPEVAITALPGKDHSQLREHVGTLYPHFSVRARDLRYSLTSDGQEELHHYPDDPNEFTNLANHPRHAETKAHLRGQLISLRDGKAWRDHASLPADTLAGFELLAEVNGAGQFRLGTAVVANVQSEGWSTIRLRVAGNRSQVWLNNRVASDEVRKTDFAAGVLTSSLPKLRKIRIRRL